ncbi:sperm acrosome membrane-associated protein 4 isoform X1 [Dendropsophus ebraccatus]|uniref:sperm acrosome membrane-associated protein 4 isoform X1 n=1 Tax=Dendropsophus ebraccatus TaxID=150705 RepID=UPI003832142B
MNRTFTAIVLCLYLTIHIGDTLDCYSCSEFCTDPLIETCSEDETCFSIEKQLGESLAKVKGCLAEDRCNTTVGESVRECCDTDLCNSGRVPGVFSMVSYGLVIIISFCLFCHTLDCYSCDYGTCLIPSKTSCGLLQLCGTETAKAGYLDLKRKGCLNPGDCLTDSSVTYLGMTVTTTRSCCLTSLCNSAAAPKVSVISGIAAIVALVLAKMS